MARDVCAPPLPGGWEPVICGVAQVAVAGCLGAPWSLSPVGLPLPKSQGYCYLSAGVNLLSVGMWAFHFSVCLFVSSFWLSLLQHLSHLVLSNLSFCCCFISLSRFRLFSSFFSDFNLFQFLSVFSHICALWICAS